MLAEALGAEIESFLAIYADLKIMIKRVANEDIYSVLRLSKALFGGRVSDHDSNPLSPIDLRYRSQGGDAGCVSGW